MRGENSANQYCGPTLMEIEEWRKQIAEYKPFVKPIAFSNSLCSFFSKSTAENIFTALWEYLSGKYGDEAEDLRVGKNTKNWKLTIRMKREIEIEQEETKGDPEGSIEEIEQ